MPSTRTTGTASTAGPRSAKRAAAGSPPTASGAPGAVGSLLVRRWRRDAFWRNQSNHPALRKTSSFWSFMFTNSQHLSRFFVGFPPKKGMPIYVMRKVVLTRGFRGLSHHQGTRQGSVVAPEVMFWPESPNMDVQCRTFKSAKLVCVGFMFEPALEWVKLNHVKPTKTCRGVPTL